jgi:SNF2 family DNA or RNA helicase
MVHRSYTKFEPSTHSRRLPKDERILVFVQFPDLMKKVTEAFEAHKIQYLQIQGSASAKSKSLEQFQNNSKERVLLLNVMDESASGANLTSANHAIFLSPLLAPSQEIYTACETQAIGRLVRYGQTKYVTVWRFLTKDTIDEEIYEQRKRALLNGA